MDIEIVKITLAFLVLINPLGALMVFLHLTDGYSSNDKKKVVRIACITVFISMAFFTLFGEMLLKGLGISLGSFRVAGGVLLFLIALSMMNAGNNPAKQTNNDINNEVQERKESGSVTSIAVVPIAIPMMVGPGGISTIIIYSSQFNTPKGLSMIVASAFFISVLCYVCLMAADRISKMLGNTGLNVINRVMGIILAALAIEIMVSGLRGLFPQLA